MKAALLLLSVYLLLGSHIIYAQLEQYNYTGVQTFESGDFTSYYLDFEFFNENIQGRAFIDYGGPDETLYYIKGTYNKQTEILQFRASFLVWTKSNIPQKDDCILRFRGKVKNLKTVKAFSGPYTSKHTTGESCSQGLLILSRVFKDTSVSEIETEEITSTTTSKETIETKPQSQPEVITKVIQPTPAIPKKSESTPIKKDENLNVYVTNNTVTLSIYDAGKVDDDTISLSINGEEILSNYSIETTKKEIKISLEKGKSVIKVIALNEGTSPPNTVKVEIKDGYKTISTRTSLNAREMASLTLIKE